MAHLVPPLILFLTKHPMVEDYNLCLRQILSGAAPLGKDLSIECTEKLGVNSIVQGKTNLFLAFYFFESDTQFVLK